MAWAQFATIASGDDNTVSLATDIQAALSERCSWCGDSIRKATIDALTVSSGEWWERAFFYTCQDVINNIITSFRRHATVTGLNFDSWSIQGLKQHLYDSHGGEASGIGINGVGAYVFLRTPTRDGGPVFGMSEIGDWIYVENWRVLYLLIDHLRWIGIQGQWIESITKNYAKDGALLPANQDAWDDMLAATPALWSTGDNLIGLVQWTASPPDYRWSDRRALMEYSYENTPVAWPASYADCRFRAKIVNVGVPFLGPWKRLTNITYSAAGAYPGSPVVLDEFTLNAVDTWETVEADTPDNIPKAATFYDVIHHPDYDNVAPPWATGKSEYANHDWGMIIVKPTTAYGT